MNEDLLRRIEYLLEENRVLRNQIQKRILLTDHEHYPKLCAWVESDIEETFTFYRLPRQHHKHLKSTNMLERLNEELKRRTHVIRIFPDERSCLRLVRALAMAD